MSTHGCTGNPCVICFPPNNVCGGTIYPWGVPIVQQQCTCYWHEGNAQGYCPIHNPGYTTPYITVGTFTTKTPGLSPEDIEKIARRVAELLKGE